MIEGRYKTFLATSHVVGGASTRGAVGARRWQLGGVHQHRHYDERRAILQTVSDRWAIEEQFHDVKEIWGAGQQQVRNLWSNIGCWNLCGWLYALVELECWDLTSEQLVDRSNRPWDNPSASFARRSTSPDRPPNAA